MAWLPFAKLEITDGTTTINLLNQQSSGFLITDWQPAIQDLKAGGTWADPPTADERELIVSQLANVEDQFTFDVSAATPDELIGHLRSLRALLNKAREYTTTEWQDTVVYLIAQGYGDTNARYTRVKNWRSPQDGFPYGPPMWATIQGNAIEDFQIIIEHGAWSENVPGTGTATELSAVETYDGRNLGNVDDTGTRAPTTADEVYIANKRNTANITDIYVDNGGVFGPNLMDAGIPFALLPAVPAIGDAVYFGIDTTLADSGPFSSLVFDIGTAGAGYTGIWRYWSGAWTILAVTDHTDTVEPLDTAGVNSVHWVPPANWTEVDLSTIVGGAPAITGYWVRMNVVTIPGALTAPMQQNRDIYSIVWPYVEIQSAAVGGDIPALISLKIHNQTYGAGIGTLQTNRVIAGLRSTDRGSNFTAYLNAADEQNPAGVTVALGASCAYANSNVVPSGRYVLYSPAGISAQQAGVSFRLDSTISTHFYGGFHAFIRSRQTGGAAGDIGVALRLEAGDAMSTIALWQTREIYFVDITVDYVLMDLGHITIPTSIVDTDEVWSVLDLVILLSNSNAAPGTASIYDLILIPVDEWAGDFSGAFDITPDYYLFIDSINRPKNAIRALSAIDSNDRFTAPYLSIASGPAILQANQTQRLWFAATYVGGATDNPANPHSAHSIRLERQQRYWSMRGTG